MAEINQFTYGPVTPILAYTLSVLGALLGLTCAVRARSTTSGRRRAWYLLLAAWAIGGTGIWVMHFIGMVGFGVRGTEIRYDLPLTVASALIAVAVVAAGLFIVGFGRPQVGKTLLGGLVAGTGIAAMHYTGMSAMHVDGDISYDTGLVVASVVIALVAATAALWLAMTVRRGPAIIGSALLMGVAVSGMHYTGMYAAEVHVHGQGDPQQGATVFSLILPILLLVVLALVGVIAALLAAPESDDAVPGAGEPAGAGALGGLGGGTGAGGRAGFGAGPGFGSAPSSGAGAGSGFGAGPGFGSGFGSGFGAGGPAPGAGETAAGRGESDRPTSGPPAETPHPHGTPNPHSVSLAEASGMGGPSRASRLSREAFPARRRGTSPDGSSPSGTSPGQPPDQAH